jgi:uncharacterized protein (TIGR02611 family)
MGTRTILLAIYVMMFSTQLGRSGGANRRVFLVIAGFTLLLAGVVMLVTPGPVMLVIFIGLGLLAAEFVWARRLMNRIKHEGERVRDAVWKTRNEQADE